MLRNRVRGIAFCLLFCLLIPRVNGLAQSTNELMPQDLTHTSLFVSLGSFCGAARLIQRCEMRTASFPFDWITSLDGEKFIELVEDDFLYFLHPDFLVRDDRFTQNTYQAPVNGNVLLNTYYHLEFLHEGKWKDDYCSTMEAFRFKYERRIARFMNLKTFPGKVFLSDLPITPL